MQHNTSKIFSLFFIYPLQDKLKNVLSILANMQYNEIFNDEFPYRLNLGSRMFFSEILNPSEKNIYFIGIGGIGISGMAEILSNLGFNVSGSDISENSNILRLRKLGIKTYVGHDAKNIENADFIIRSTAINDENVEVKAAKQRKIPLLDRFQMLAELMRFKCSVAISGSHGKTTTTSLSASLFKSLGKAPTVISGGIINEIGTNAYLDDGNFLIAEADESDATFIKIPATVAVVTNVDPEHLNFYGNFDNLKKSFVTFIENIPFYGFAVLCGDRPELLEIKDKISDKRILTYGIDNENSDILAHNIIHGDDGQFFDVKIKGKNSIEKIFLPMHGKHNVLNALAAISVAVGFEFDHSKLPLSFSEFKGVKRRFSVIDKINNVTYVDDYAHHPTEIKCTIDTAKSIIKTGKIIVIAEPHRYSRLKDLFSDFTHAFDDASIVAITDVFSAGEEQIEGCSKESLAAAINQGSGSVKAHAISIDHVADFVNDHAKEGDYVIFMGAGKISKIAYDSCVKIKEV